MRRWLRAEFWRTATISFGQRVGGQRRGQALGLGIAADGVGVAHICWLYIVSTGTV